VTRPVNRQFGIALRALVMIAPLLPSGASGQVDDYGGISLTGSYYCFFTPTWFQQNFTTQSTVAPALGVDISLAGSVALSGRIAYAGVTGSIDYGGGYRYGHILFEEW
jgi:hypothetical protein